MQPFPRSRAQPLPDAIHVLGETTFRRSHRRFGLLPADRLRHVYLLGKTGAGKSTLLESLIAQDLARGAGVAVLDPHGDLIEAMLPLVPATRIRDVLLFAPEDRDWPVSFNVFRQGRRLHSDTALLTSQLLSVFRRHWAQSWGPRLEHVLRNGILAVADDPRATLLFLYRFLTDEQLRERVVAGVRDPVVHQFWTKEYPSYSRNLQSEALAPALNKLGSFAASPVVRAIIGQERSRVDLVELMQNRNILFAKLPTGRIGDDASRLLGALILTTIQLAAMERPRGGPPFFVYVDEFQNFVTESLSTMLSESRKFGLGLTLAHQYLAQLPDGLASAVLGNVGTIVLFRVGAADATVLESEFAPIFTALDLQSMARHEVAVKMIANGDTLAPFSARTLPPEWRRRSSTDHVRRIVEQSRARFARPRSEVEPHIARSLGNDRAAIHSAHLTPAG